MDMLFIVKFTGSHLSNSFQFLQDWKELLIFVADFNTYII